MNLGKCETCKYCQRTEVLRCHRRSPELDPQGFARWPMVQQHHSCGEWEASQATGGYLIPLPPGLSSEERDDWQARWIAWLNPEGSPTLSVEFF